MKITFNDVISMELTWSNVFSMANQIILEFSSNRIESNHIRIRIDSIRFALISNRIKLYLNSIRFDLFRTLHMPTLLAKTTMLGIFIHPQHSLLIMLQR